MKRFIAVILFVLFFNLFLFHPWGSTAFVLQRIGFLALLLALFHRTVFQPVSRNRSLVYIAILGAACVGLITHTSLFPTALLHALSLTVLLFFIYEYAVTTLAIRSLLEVCLIPFRTGFEYLSGCIRLLGSIFAAREKQPAASSIIAPYRRLVQSLLVGVIVGLPAVFILTTLFSNADPIFAKFVEQSTTWLQHLFNADTWQRLIIRSVFSLFLFGILVPLLYFGRKPRVASLPSFARYRWTTELTVALLMIALTVGTFLVVQWPYVFVTVPFETDLSRFGVATYSEYVTRGFFELVVASFFLYGVLWVVHILTREQPMQQRRFLRFAQAIVLALFAILIISVFRRVYLYQWHHGWTLARIYGSFGLLWISMLTTTFAGRLLQERRWVTIEMAATALLFLFAGLWNAERFIVHSHPPTVNKRVDYVYLSRMSPDGVDGWLQAFGWAQQVLLSETLANKEVLDRVDRQNIAYAGTIISHLTVEYDRLVTTYGSTEEQKTYYLAMLGPFSRRVRDQQAAEAARILQQWYAPQTPSVSVNELQENYLSKRMFVYAWWQPVQYDPSQRDMYRFYDMWPKDSAPEFADSQPPDRLSRLFLWNYAEQRAYDRLLKEDIGSHWPSWLASTQEAFYRLYDKILTQPENERDYDQDLSFRSPFLD